MPSPTLPQRLKERKIVQWALAYLAGAFVVFQLLDALAEPLALPTTLQRAILAVVGIGFFITLVLAWYHGEKGRQRVSGPELLMITALLVIAGAVLSTLQTRGDDRPGSVLTDSAQGDRPSIAVLPFDNFSPRPEDAYFADGMQEQLVSTLSKIRGLSVRGRTSAMRYREDPKPFPEVAEELGVEFIVEGSARISGGRVSVTAQLVDPERDEHLWSEEYDRDFSVDDIVSIHREVAGQVASQLRAVLTPAEQRQVSAAPTANIEAFEYYLRGREAWRRRSTSDLRAAVGFFDAALEQDEGFARASAGLADAL